MKAALLYGARDIRIEQRIQPGLGPGMAKLRITRVGICGSDLHYYQHGRCGSFVPDRPFVLGHELSGNIVALADDVSKLKVGQRVTVNPARSCGLCEYCKRGQINLCRNLIMLGSASTTPPTDGAFAEYVTVRWDQCHVLPADIDDGYGSMMEPLAVALHAVRRSGDVSGKRVLIVGAGTIGMLAAMTARAFGAVPIAVIDINQARREKAVELGADVVLDPLASDLRSRVREVAGDGFDIVFEASGAAQALRSSFDHVRPGGTIVQIGTLGAEDIPIPANQIMAHEINLIGSMRYGEVFDDAIRLVVAKRINLRPFIDRLFTLDDSIRALEFAGDKSHTLKVQIEI